MASRTNLASRSYRLVAHTIAELSSACVVVRETHWLSGDGNLAVGGARRPLSRSDAWLPSVEHCLYFFAIFRSANEHYSRNG